MKNRAQMGALAAVAIILVAALSARGSIGSTGPSASGAKNLGSVATNVASNNLNLISTRCVHEKGFDVPDTGLTSEQIKDNFDTSNSALSGYVTRVPGLTGDDDLTKGPNGRETLIRGAQCLRDLGYDVKNSEPGKDINIQDIPRDALNKHFGSPGGAKRTVYAPHVSSQHQRW